METQRMRPTEAAIIKLDYLPSVNYSMLNNGIEVCSSLVIENTSSTDWQQVSVNITGPYIKDSICRLEVLRRGESVQLNSIKIEPDIQLLSETTEAVRTTFLMTVKSVDDTMAEQEYPITLLSYEEWAGSGVMPEHLAAFVVPNNPLLPKIKLAAARFLENWTGSSAFDEYQTQDRNRVRAQVAAIYEALRSEGIIYSAPPASFEETGQRIRMADKVLTEKMGTCLDTSLLIASCLEEIGLFPIVVMLRGHAMVGAWLVPNVFPQMVCDDASYLLKEMADGNNNVVLLESTAITSSGNTSFEDAVSMAAHKLRDESSFLYFLDIHRCRLGNIRPMPQRVEKNGRWTFANEGLKHQNATTSVNRLSHYDLRLEDSGKLTTKQMIWERKLLDFSLRNNLLNTRLGRKVIPFISFGIDHWEDHLQNGEDYSIAPSPGKKIEPNADGMYDSKLQAADYEHFVSELIGNHKMASFLTEGELQASLKYIYRTARTSLEENGANSLFLTLGMLKWYETSKSEQPRYAPILLLPVDIVRRTSSNYIIRKRDEDIILNITLTELLKQNFNINLDALNELPKDDSGVDVKQIFTYVRRAIMEQKRWNVLEESMLGLFSFNKFVMWNDIHSNADKLKENAVIASLIEKRDTQTEGKAIDAREIDKNSAPMDFAIPLDVDSSQMEAIVASGSGRSFILHGPPGTGKSQTITNMIANALYQGKRVLFVAEKMAALSVVQSRLEKINLAPFCLELHSNKATKKHFLEQMDEVLKVTKIKSPEDYAKKSEELYNERQELISYMEALHQKGAGGLSLYECISAYLAIAEEEITEQLPPRDQLTVAYIEQCHEQTEQLNTILDIVGQPGKHPLHGLEPKDNRLETQEGIFQLLNDFRDSYHQLTQSLQSGYGQAWTLADADAWTRDWENVQAKWWLPRYFAKKQFFKTMTTQGFDRQKAESVIALNQSLTTTVCKLNAQTLLPNNREGIVSHMDTWLSGQRKMRDWYHWVDKKQELQQMGATAAISRIEGGTRPEVAINGFLKGMYSQAINTAIDENEQLRMFNGLKFRQKIEKYKRDTARFQELSKEELYSKLAARVPSTSAATAEGSEISILKRNIANGGRGNSIRTIIDSIPTLLPRLCPCMLMSPISVAQFLDLNNEKFDLVIFDEASQMPTSEAVGAIARGKSLIVVGDSKQMPPTSFFTTSQVDEEEAYIDDMESILDDCITLSLSEYQLNWHYRSKHESLIAFSNSQYYDNHLLTFPSVDDHVAKVSLVPVNGVYDKGRTRSNPEESKAIVKEIVRRLSDPVLQRYSIGVVAFSKVQGDLIEDDLMEELDKHPQLKEAAFNCKEPVFVKNLENVQGDERDVILFSIGYGADKNGKVSMNFGPLNNAGGERRLNVAVSRARYEMIVYSSLKSSQIDLNRSNAKGVEGLKGFLEFAETGKLPFVSSSARHAEPNVMVSQIADALTEKGYIAESFVGRSDFKVDIAVATPQHPEKYIVGILCDGKNYFDTKTTRDREIVQPNVLQMLNWRVTRVYSIDWYDNQERTLNQILKELEEAEAVMDEPQPMSEEKPAYVFDQEKIRQAEVTPEVRRNQAQQPYREYDRPALTVDKETFNPYDEKYVKIVKQIVKEEQPVTESYLCKRLAKALGFGHAGANIQRAVAAALPKLYQDPLSVCDVNSYWLSVENAKDYQGYRAPSPRNITEIPAVEIVNAIKEVVQEEFSLPADKIPTLTARKLGFASAGAKIIDVIRTVLSILERQQAITVNNNMVSLNDN